MIHQSYLSCESAGLSRESGNLHNKQKNSNLSCKSLFQSMFSCLKLTLWQLFSLNILVLFRSYSCYFTTRLYHFFLTAMWPQNLKKLFYKKQLVQNQRGQVIVEYILLLVVSTVLALILINLVTVDPDKNSPVFGYWGKLLQVIGKDIST